MPVKTLWACLQINPILLKIPGDGTSKCVVGWPPGTKNKPDAGRGGCPVGRLKGSMNGSNAGKSGCHNIFGLFWQYYAECFPHHDPDKNIAQNDLIDSLPESPCTLALHDYYPYPNQSSCLLGEWYWNDGEKKSQSSFQNLTKIIGHPDFHPEDVAGNNWQAIDTQLSGECWAGLNEDSWEDVENNKLGYWIQTPIKINVSFHKRMLNPGQKEFNAGILQHCKLTAVIREKLTRPSAHPHLHFKPYKFFWQPSEAAEPVWVYGELFTSEAFIKAHHELQESPEEPGCDLPKVVIGLMFTSDGTQLTSFSTTKLWPMYLMIGNESKDRRSKPSCHAFEYVIWKWYKMVFCE